MPGVKRLLVLINIKLRVVHLVSVFPGLPDLNHCGNQNSISMYAFNTIFMVPFVPCKVVITFVAAKRPFFLLHVQTNALQRNLATDGKSLNSCSQASDS